MSTEQMSTNLAHSQNIGYADELKKSKKTDTHKVDINVLMDRVREEKKKEKKENIIFMSLIASVILITGVIASL
tara:strand:+ start:136 stop:357 length:222 start_codon:yes stop_codon:yes gene_type:complete